jgi:D-glycero-alpha-D-manno-heptose 1-phosphate guanylyltransferase
MQAVVLAGGYGTRLKSVISELPKPMAPVQGKPFLEYILNWLLSYDVKEVVLAVGYRSDTITSYFGNVWNGVSIKYSCEEELLGTGGGIKQAASFMHLERDSSILVTNGDTFYPVNLFAMREFHQKNESDLTLALKPMTDFERYGSVNIEPSNGEILRFREKEFCREGYVNGGVYLINSQTLMKEKLRVFSFENFMEQNVGNIKMHGYVDSSYFIDIGIPEDYSKAEKELVL